MRPDSNLDGRPAPNWRIIGTLLGAIAVVALIAVGAWVAIDRLTPSSAPPPGATSETTRSTTPTRSAENSSQAVPVPTSTLPPSVTTPSATPSAPAAPKVPATANGVVVIDPGHQAKQIKTPEPIGPGSSQKKPGTSTGTSGVVTRKPESELALEVSLKLRSELQKRGVKVIMTRTTQNVSLTNSQRAAIANKAHADLFIRIHADGSTDRSRRGIQTLIPAPNKWTKPIVKQSTIAGRDVQSAVLRTTGAIDLGVTPRGDITGFNWSKVPTTLVEVGFMSNPVEDRLLSTQAYQRKLAVGMANGVVTYLRSAKK